MTIQTKPKTQTWSKYGLLVDDNVLSELGVSGDDAAFQLTVVFDGDAVVNDAVAGKNFT